MHILFVWAYLEYPEVALEPLRKLQAFGHKISVIVGKPIKNDFGEGIYFHCPPESDILSRFSSITYPVFNNILAEIKTIDPDIVHVNSHLFFCNYQVIKASNSLKIPSVVTVHGFVANRTRIINGMQQLYIKSIGRSFFKNVTKIICLNKNDAANVAMLVNDRNKISIIPNGADTHLFKPCAAKEPNLITWVGRMVPEKGLFYLLNALPKIADECANARLALVGDGFLRPQLVKMANRLKITNRVHFLGQLSRAEVARILSESSIFVFPSLREGMPLALLEAMSCGVPVVGSNIPAINELVTDGFTGLLVPPQDSEALARVILSLLYDESLRKLLGKNSRRLVLDKYSWDINVLKLERLYNEVIDNSCNALS